jgi:plasmid stability protein
MSDLNLRGVKEELIKRLKVEAAVLGRTLRDHCVLILEGKEVGAIDFVAERKAIEPSAPTKVKPEKMTTEQRVQKAYEKAGIRKALVIEEPVLESKIDLHEIAEGKELRTKKEAPHPSRCGCNTCMFAKKYGGKK